MNWPAAPRDWWELKSRAELEAQAKRETPRMANSLIGRWREVNAEMDAPRRSRRMWHDDQEDEQ